MGGVPLIFKFCPSCGAGSPAFLESKRWHCKYCGFDYFHNVATAAGIIIDRLGEIVFIERAKEPQKGKLGLPGGFVDPGERAEDAALRECREEIDWRPPSLAFLGSYPNAYEYGGVSYNTCDLYFYYRFPKGADMPRFSLNDGEAAAVRLISLAKLRDSELAFTSLAQAIHAYRKLTKESLSR
jgi:ADP-ribose pyrophosphatase YjhB (NUDIX family)